LVWDDKPLEKIRGTASLFDVAPCPAAMSVCSSSVNCLRIFAGEPSTSEPAGFWSHSNQRVCADDGTRANFDIVENDCAHADEYFIVDLACVNVRRVPDRDQFAYACWVTGVNVDDSIVLNVRARPMMMR